MPALHILIAHSDDVDHAYECANASRATDWIVPKAALIGDEVALFHRGEGIFAIGNLKSTPAKATEGTWAGRYRGSLGDLRVLSQPFSLDELAAEIPEWNWVRYPKMYTTPAAAIATALRDLFEWDGVPPLPDVDLPSAVEGGVRLAWHLVAERDAGIVAAKKADTLAKTGALSCEVCGFDFRRRYGERGNGFCEVHHLNPLSERAGPEETSLADLAIICSNCHRMAHRGGLVELEELRSMLR